MLRTDLFTEPLFEVEGENGALVMALTEHVQVRLGTEDLARYSAWPHPVALQAVAALARQATAAGKRLLYLTR